MATAILRIIIIEDSTVTITITASIMCDQWWNTMKKETILLKNLTHFLFVWFLFRALDSR